MPSGPLPAIPASSVGLNAKLLTKAASSAEGEATPAQAPPEEDTPLTRAKRSVTFSENLVTIIDEERLNERAAYLEEKREELYEALLHLGEEEDHGLVDRHRKRASFLVEEKMLTDLTQLKETGKKKRTVWSLMGRKKSGEGKKQLQQQQQQQADDKKLTLTGKKSKPFPLIVA